MNLGLFLPFCLIGLFLGGCSSEGESLRRPRGEYIYRLHHEFFFSPPPPEARLLPIYPWDSKIENLPKITKEYFRCKGSSLNAVKTLKEGEELRVYQDCSGVDGHSLPLRNDKEFIYPILIDLANYLQMKTGKRIVITAGHRCPLHHAYVDPSPANQCSKHMMGAEMSFYIEGLESQPEAVVKWIIAYYQETPKYQEQKEYIEFKRYDKPDTDVRLQPWYNKEIFIKLYQKHEGRDLDNRHPYPYLRVQVRYDWETQERVIYSWDKAHHNYLRR
jgi:hypothetical protein